MRTVLIDDTAITSKKQDELGRGNLVDVVVEAIKTKVSDQHPAICLGIYGEWGEGKSSFMRMINEGLNECKNTTILWFNPWDLSDPKKMVIEFFAKLSRLTSDDSGTLSVAINSYGKAFLTSVSSLDNSDISSYRERLSHCIPRSSNLKESISEGLVSSDKHVVFFIDDVDRLQASEIRTIFQLIRQIADFENIIYIIGMDPEMVSVALGDSYGNNKMIGRDYLKKFVQIPIILPPIQDSRLQLLFKKRLANLLSNCKIEVSESDLSLVSETIIGALRSIRDINRFVNQLSLVLPIIHFETDFVDLCLVESLKYLNEQGWISIYHSMDALLRNNRPQVRVTEEIKKRRDRAIQSITGFYSEKNRDYVYRVLNSCLFPEQKLMYHHDPASKCIINEVYFRRYFICGVPDGVIPHADLLVFKKRIDKKDLRGAISWLDSQAVFYSASEIERIARTTLYIEQKSNQNTEEPAVLVSRALSLSRLANEFSYSTIQNKNSIDTTIGCVIIPHFLGKLENGDFVVNKHRESSLLKDIFTSSPLNFCMNLLQAVYSRYGVTPSDEDDVFRVLRDRVLKGGVLELFNYSFVIKQVFFSIWRRTAPEGCNRFLIEVLGRDDFDIGLEIKNWLEAAGEKEELQQIVYLSNVYNPVIDALKQNLAHSSVKTDSHVKKFVANCGMFDVLSSQ
jgi:hypothetical protein